MEPNEAGLASKITGPGQRATLSAVLDPGMTAATVRVNDVEDVAGFVLPGDHVDVMLTRQGEKNTAATDVVIEDAQVLAIDQLADEKTDKPSVVKAVTLEVKVTDGERVALASTVGTLSLLLRKAGDVADEDLRRVTPADLGKPTTRNSDFVTIAVTRASKNERVEYSVPVEHGGAHAGDHAAALSHPAAATRLMATTQRSEVKSFGFGERVSGGEADVNSQYNSKAISQAAAGELRTGPQRAQA